MQQEEQFVMNAAGVHRELFELTIKHRLDALRTVMTLCPCSENGIGLDFYIGNRNDDGTINYAGEYVSHVSNSDFCEEHEINGAIFVNVSLTPQQLAIIVDNLSKVESGLLPVIQFGAGDDLLKYSPLNLRRITFSPSNTAAPTDDLSYWTSFDLGISSIYIRIGDEMLSPEYIIAAPLHPLRSFITEQTPAALN